MADFQSGFYIEVTTGADRGRIIALHAYRIPLGRRFKEGEKKKGWILFTDPSVHRAHAVLDWDDEKKEFSLLNKDPLKRTFVNQERQDGAPLAAGDRVRLGELEFNVLDHLEPEQEKRCEYVALFIRTTHIPRAQGDEEIDRLAAMKDHKKITPQFTTILPQQTREMERPGKQQVKAPAKSPHPQRTLSRVKPPTPDFYILLFKGNLKLSRYPFYVNDLPAMKVFWLVPGRDTDEPPHFDHCKQGPYLFELLYREKKFFVLSPGTAQIRINRKSIGPGETQQLMTGDEITCERFRMIFIEHQILEELNRWEIHVTEGVPEDHGKRFAITRQSLSLGRGKSCDIALSDTDIALFQATIHFESHRFFIIQRSTTRLTYVNNTLLKTGRDKYLRDNDLIRLGTITTLRLVKKAGEAEPRDD
jgi:pSer/pThr/pTyr-binding forkhead associated (FHA) protein